jgi:hypothetical protein
MLAIEQDQSHTGSKRRAKIEELYSPDWKAWFPK